MSEKGSQYFAERLRRRHRNFVQDRRRRREEHLKFHETHHRFHENHFHEEFRRYHKNIKFVRLAILLFNLVMWYLLYRFIGLKAVGVSFAVILSLKGIGEFFFILRLEKRILKPIEKLKNGLEEIARGNYNVKIDPHETFVMGSLVESFNDMARRLQESEKVKAEYEENRKMLVANISHDLKTPVTSIQGYIEAILDRKELSEEHRARYLQTIYHNSVYINKLIDDLFLFSKLDMQKLNFVFEKVSIKAFMTDLMEEFKFELEEKECNFIYEDTVEQDSIIAIDRKRMNQAFRNIIGNAVKYGPERQLSIEVKLYKRDGLICVDIGDNGPGIPSNKIPYVFDRFYRLEQERTKDLTSTGLGLAIAKELVEAHAGKITVSSKEGQGTCFTVTLPDTEPEETHNGVI